MAGQLFANQYKDCRDLMEDGEQCASDDGAGAASTRQGRGDFPANHGDDTGKSENEEDLAYDPGAAERRWKE